MTPTGGARRRLSTIVGQAISSPEPASKPRELNVAVWGPGGDDRRMVKVLRPLCEGVGVRVHAFPPQCSVLFPMFHADLFSQAAEKIPDDKRQEAVEAVRSICAICDVWLGWPQSSWGAVSDIIGGWPERLRWIQTFSAGTDELVKVAPPRVVVTRAAGKFDASIAEWVLTWVFMHAKKTHLFVEAQRESTWRRQFRNIFHVAGSTALIVGYGSIGQRTAQLCTSVGMKVVGTRRSVTEVASDGAVAVHPSTDLHDLLPTANYVVICLPSTEKTRSVFGASELALMKPGAALINIARGDIVDWAQIRAALHEGRLGAYYTDVTTPEPLPEGHPDWATPNFFVTPHNTWAPAPDITDDARRFFENLQLLLAGERLQGLVDRAKGY